MSNEDLKKRIRHIQVLDDFAAKSFLGDNEKPKDKEDFYAHCPLDSIIKTPQGDVAYGYINSELAALVKGEEAPVLVTEEVYHHLISKQEKRDIDDMRVAVQEAMSSPTAVVDGSGDGSFNIYFSHKNEDGKEKPMYINLKYCEKPISCYTVRSIVPAFKVRGDILAQGEDIPSMRNIPEGTSHLEEKITSTYGDRVTGATWNKGNLLKTLRLFSEENELPNAKEMEEIKTWLAEGDKDWMQKHFGLYIKQALEQTHADKFFQIAKESGVLAAIAPELDAVVTPEFLDKMQRVDDKSVSFKQSVILSDLAKQADDKSAMIGDMAGKYALQEGKEEAKNFSLYSNRLMKSGKGDVELLWTITESITNNFKNPELLNDVKEMCEVHSPEVCLTPVFKEKMKLCGEICEKAPALKTKISEVMKTMPREATKDDRLQAQENVKKEFMQALANDFKSREKPLSINTGGRE